MDRKRKRQSGIELEWTASRCQRLLRPLASRIAPLRRHQYTINTESSQGSTESRSLQDGGMAKNNFNTNALDPTWLPNERRPQLKKYSSRGQKYQPVIKHNASPQASLMTLPTPFKARAMRRGTPIKHETSGFEVSNSPCASKNLPLVQNRRTRKDPFTRAPVAKKSIELQNRQNFEKIFELHQGVTDGFSLLLQRTATADTKAQPRRGASSLLEMCLRKVPDYIQAEEQWRKSIDEDDETDVSAEVYEELENLSSVSGRGWPGLREVVIAHGVSLVREIIRDKLVSTDTRAELARMPARHGLHKASKDLGLAYAHSLPLKRPLNVESHLFEGCLVGLANIGPSGFLDVKNDAFVNILDDLFVSGQLKMSWLATRDMTKLSSNMIRALASRSGDSLAIINFLENRISQISNAEMVGHQKALEVNFDTLMDLEKSLSNGSVSIITVLTAIVLIERNANQSQQDSALSVRVGHLLTHLAIDVFRNLRHTEQQKSNVSEGELKSGPYGVCFAILASNLVLCINQDAAKSEMVSLHKKDILKGMLSIHEKSLKKNARAQTMIERAASFMVDLSRCCGQSLHSDSQDYLEDLVRLTLLDSEHGSRLEDTLLKQLALEASLHFAKTSATQRSRSFMESIEATLTRQGPLGIQSPAIKSHRNVSVALKQGLRWEEGLCEWIAATPLPMTKSRRSDVATSKANSRGSSDRESDLDDSGYLSNLETPAPQRRHTGNISQLLASPDMLGMDANLDHYSPIASPGGLPDHDSHSEPRETCSTTGPTRLSRHVSPKITSVPLIVGPSKPKQIMAESETQSINNSVSSKEYETKTPEPKRKKPRPGRSIGQQRPKASTSDPLISTNAPTCSSQDSHNEPGLIDMGDEMDELAMSCAKLRRELPSYNGGGHKTRKQGLPKLARITTKRMGNGVLDDSDDELGM